MKLKIVALLCLIIVSMVGCGSKGKDQESVATDSLVNQSSDTEELSSDESSEVQKQDYSSLSMLPINLGADMNYYSYLITKDVTVDNSTERVMTVNVIIDANSNTSEIDSSMLLDGEIVGSRVYNDLNANKTYVCAVDTDDVIAVSESGLENIRDSYQNNFESILADNWELVDETETSLYYSCNNSGVASMYLSQGTDSMFDNVVYTSQFIVTKDNYNIEEYSFSVEGDEIDSNSSVLSHKKVDYKMQLNNSDDSTKLVIPDGFDEIEVGYSRYTQWSDEEGVITTEEVLED